MFQVWVSIFWRCFILWSFSAWCSWQNFDCSLFNVKIFDWKLPGMLIDWQDLIDFFTMLKTLGGKVIQHYYLQVTVQINQGLYPLLALPINIFLVIYIVASDVCGLRLNDRESPFSDEWARDCLKNAKELLNLRVPKCSHLHKIHIFHCMGKIFCGGFQNVP